MDWIKHALRNKNSILIAVTAVVMLMFGFLNKSYLGLENIKNLMNSMSYTGTVCVGIALLLISGEVDLAAGAEACFGGIFTAMLISAGVPWPFGVVAAILFGVIAGCINAFFVNKLNLMGFIATIGIMSIYTGLIRVVSRSQNIPVPTQYQSFYKLGSLTLFDVVPLPFLIMLVLMIVYGWILTYTTFGRSIYLVGGNRRAARLCGIDCKKTTTLLYINNGALAGLAGAVLAARMRSASPVSGETVALDAITAVVLGGVSFVGGVGSMTGCFFGILLLTAFKAGLTAIGLQSYWQIIAQGALLVVALSVDFFTENARRRALERQTDAQD